MCALQELCSVNQKDSRKYFASFSNVVTLTQEFGETFTLTKIINLFVFSPLSRSRCKFQRFVKTFLYLFNDRTLNFIFIHRDDSGESFYLFIFLMFQRITSQIKEPDNRNLILLRKAKLDGNERRNNFPGNFFLCALMDI